MTTGSDNTGRDPAGRFAPGNSGNLSGKPLGTRHRATRMAEKLMAGDTEAVKCGPNTIVAQARPNEEHTATLARTVLQPSIKGAMTIKEYSKNCGGLDLTGLVGELSDQAKAANDGDLKRAEGMLMVQAHTLDAIFNSLAQRSINAEYMDTLDRYLRLGLKAQSQCRATLETLAAIKNPHAVAFVRQANIGENVQVNNAGEPRAGAGETEKPQNELLEEKPHERLDTRTPGAAVGSDPAMATVGTFDRAEVRRG